MRFEKRTFFNNAWYEKHAFYHPLESLMLARAYSSCEERSSLITKLKILSIFIMDSNQVPFTYEANAKHCAQWHSISSFVF